MIFWPILNVHIIIITKIYERNFIFLLVPTTLKDTNGITFEGHDLGPF
jgi:hypothetical protein